jgi:hypothetical protein
MLKCMSRRIAVWAFAFVLAGTFVVVAPQLSFAHIGNPQEYQYDYDRDYTPREVFQIGYRQGFEEGSEHGISDGRRGVDFNYLHSVEYRRGTEGWTPDMGYMDVYRRAFQRGYARGYRTGYNRVNEGHIRYSPFRD